MTTALGSGNQDFVWQRGSGTTFITDFKSTYFQATMSGSSEVPANASAATGGFTGWLNFGQTRFDFSGTFTGLDFDGTQTPSTNDNVVGMHLHNAVPGVPGPVVFDIFSNTNTLINAGAGSLSGFWDQAGGLSATNIQKLFADELYVNTHTVSFPGGEIRGQITQVDSGADRIDLRSLNIGTFDTLKLLTSTVNGDAVMTVFADGLATKLRLDGVTRTDLKATDFIFADDVARTVTGSSGRDDLFSGNGNDAINARGGNDRLFGDGGNDTLRGGAGNDLLYGGTGKDILTGGTGADSFVFRSTAEGGSLNSKADVIADFQLGDLIDLSAIDANATVAGSQAFVFNTISSIPSPVPGELTVITGSTDTFVYLKTTSDPQIDMVIKILGVHVLTASDFVL